MEEHIFFNSGGLKLEGLLDAHAGKKAVVVTHPPRFMGAPCIATWWRLC